MQETLSDHHTSLSIGGRHIGNLRFYDDIDLMGGSNGELQVLANRLVDRTTAYVHFIHHRKAQDHDNSTNNISADISMNGQRSEEVTSFEYLGSNPVQGYQICSAEIRINIA